ncbi:hypothetical protein CG007_01815 [Mesoplasma entomophilum]|uniref:hypothetical protein n=1 Tax=Mesoplasma entomophilum TaxID=2149 RepID=UPI000D02C18D|nr:hypothetical protein [Mesoplasma entomophilum]AVN60353.1 hypothetical protein CG007_01815 [Mesoplasma entomophilum]
MEKEQFKKILDNIDKKYRDFQFIGSYEELQKNKDWIKISEVIENQIKPNLKDDNFEFSDMINQYSDAKFEYILTRNRKTNYISWHWWGFRWHIGYEAFVEMVNSVREGPKLPPGSIPVTTMISLLTTQAPVLAAAIGATMGVAAIYISQAAICICSKEFWNSDKNVVVGFSYFITPLVNCYLE